MASGEAVNHSWRQAAHQRDEGMGMSFTSSSDLHR